jgi:malto-oligosyltrehalose trehalohydrolase
MKRRHEASFGAEVTGSGVRFRVWAPRAAAVTLRLENDEPAELLMVKEANGAFVLTTPAARPGTRYRYVVDGKAYPDPGSRRQPDGVHGASEVVDPYAYDWGDQDWRGRPWEEVVLYELHLGAFSQGGDFADAVPHLEHLCRLGVTAIELMPITEFPGARNWGYDGTFLYAPCSCYGRPEDLKALVEACHRRGLAIMLDVVYNHFGPEGNYLPAIAPDFFTVRYSTPWGAAIDFDGPQSRAVRDFIVDNALYWLEEYHFDGLRLDAVHAIYDDSAPDIIDEIAETVRHRFPEREIHLVLENDLNEARRLQRDNCRPKRFTAQWNDDLHHALHVLITGETVGYYQDYAASPAESLARALAEGFAYQGEPSPFRGGRPRGEASAALPSTAFVAFLQNHDHVGNHPFGTRLPDRTSEARLHAGLAIVLLSPQTPLLFMGEEWASYRPFLFFCDFAPDLAQSVRDGRRREFAHFPGFSDEAARDRIPDPTAITTFDMSKLDWQEPMLPEHALWLARYRALIKLRAHEIVPHLDRMAGFSGTYRLLGPREVSVEWRLGSGARLLLAANFSEHSVAPPDTAGGWRLLYASDVPGAPESATFFLRERAAECND